MLNILYEDDAVVVVEKPVGIPSEPVNGDGMVPRLAAQLNAPVWLVHRLDRGTGGAMAFAKNKFAAAGLSAMIARPAEPDDPKRFRKTYLAVVHGTPEPATGTMRDLLLHDRARNKSFVVTRPRKGVREAVLTYRVLGTVPHPDGVRSLAEIALQTGRTHQIRVQFASRKWMLVGDARYGSPVKGDPALWCVRLRFPHPVTGRPVAVVCPPPTDGVWGDFAAVRLPDELLP